MSEFRVTLVLPSLEAEDPAEAIKRFHEEVHDAERDGHNWQYTVENVQTGRRVEVIGHPQSREVELVPSLAERFRRYPR